jgi:nitroreductase
MDLFDSIQGRKSIRRFKQTLVPDEDIKKILDAGRRAPSANNTQPWSFIVVKNRTVLKQMADAARQMIDRMIPYAESEKQAQRLAMYKGNYYTFFENAPVLIAVILLGLESCRERVFA